MELLWASALPHTAGSKAHSEDVTGAISTGSGGGRGPSPTALNSSHSIDKAQATSRLSAVRSSPALWPSHRCS